MHLHPMANDQVVCEESDLIAMIGYKEGYSVNHKLLLQCKSLKSVFVQIVKYLFFLKFLSLTPPEDEALSHKVNR